MKNVLIFLLLMSTGIIYSQVLYSPQGLYEEAGGFFDKDSLRSIYIDFEDSDYHDILVNSFFNSPSYRIPATVTLNGIVHDSVGVRYKGNSTFCLPNDQGNPKVPYNLDMNYWVSGQKLMGLKKVKLANAWLDPTFTKEFSASQIYKNYLPTPEVNLTKLYVQGDYLGLFVNTESVNKQFVEKHFDEKDGVLFKGDGAGVFCGGGNGGEPVWSWISADSSDYYSSYTIKSDHGWAELMDLIYTLNFNPTELDTILNIDRVLWAFAVNSVISNLDTYNGYYVHNYYLYQTEDGLFQMIPWDLSESFVGAIMGWSYWNQEEVYEFDLFFGKDPSEGRPLTAYLFNNDHYRKIYTAHVRTVIDEAMDTSVIRGKINHLQSLAYDAANSDVNKAFPMDMFSSNVEEALWTGWGFGGIMSTINERKDYLLAHPEVSLEAPVIDEISITVDKITVSILNETSVELMVTQSEYNSKFQSYLMNDDGTNGDEVAGDGTYTTLVPFGGIEDFKYYVRAENDDAIALSPARAEYEFYEYSIITNTLNELESNNGIKIFPNPTNSTINIEVNISEPIIYELISPLGKLISSGILDSTNNEVDLSKLSPNVYFLKIGKSTFRILKI